jgi:UDP-N-acetylglucosamine 2-epimerase (non-hydrolysing)
MFRVITVVGTRPEIIRLSRIIPLIDRYCHHFLIHTGQNYDYELNQVFFDELGIRKPDYFLDAAGGSAAETIGNVIINIDKIIERLRPDAILILGDTNSALAAIPAKRRKVPIFHMEAGNRCFDLRVPEEINRRIVDHISDINLTYSQIARQYLIREGLPPDHIICTGSPMKEVLDYYKPQIDKSNILDQLSISKKGYFLISAHREENVDSQTNLLKIFSVLENLCVDYGLPVIVSTHPRTKNRIDSLELKANSLVHFCKPFGFIDYVKLQQNALTVLSDSGTITEESSILNFPALNIREAHERPEGSEEGAVMMVGLEYKTIRSALKVLLDPDFKNISNVKIVEDYTPTNVSHKVIRIILSNINFIKSNTWRLYPKDHSGVI